ncbi:MAG: hypothetical protein WD080_01940 [Egibacteraceae bacterium]
MEAELIDDLKRVRGKEGILFRIAEASVAQPDGPVRTVVFPVAGEATLQDLVREAKANEQTFGQRVRTVLASSYSAYYRRMLPSLLCALDFRCNNTAYRPVMDAIDLLGRYTSRPARVKHYDDAETVPIEGVVPRQWREAVVDGSGRVERVSYEICVLRWGDLPTRALAVRPCPTVPFGPARPCRPAMPMRCPWWHGGATMR